MVQRELAKHCGSTALASSMHQHVTAFTAWRYRRGLPGAEGALRKVTGGRGFFRGSPIERAYRDIRAIKFHPLSFDATLLHAGRLALGVPCDRI